MSRWLRVPAAVGSLVLGIGLGVLAVAVHGLLPGMVLLVVATGATAYALPQGWATRLPFALGWFGLVIFASQPRPEGDYLVAANARGYSLLGCGVLLLLFCTVTLRRPGSGS